ncbi:4'-phosphopantetheinyl transferase family protein [Neotabrizicola shimadae]|uniref:Enterobactin synthase component D n=1 Tax=Neotabrizicola shimadae TaxID=2807096 RepID=A0A8G1EAW0_9RHOB|nr:4'-phosphopantetheinyl transferase superfamily protein [Neotabrizicola shimadae]QYZ69010.1 4'-phosphopantetheinyl transferase superfamily protein [Neotabrizicola shimadae]
MPELGGGVAPAPPAYLGKEEALSLVARWLAPGFALAAADPRAEAPHDPDTPPGVIPRRAREFAAGRRAARAAARQAGLVLDRLPMGEDRAPLWPEGVTGTISHSDRLCLAIVGPASAGAIGLDLEPETPLDPLLWDTILNPSERAALPRDEPGRAAMVVFAAKEAAYKAQYPLTRRLFGFHDLEVTLVPGAFRATFTAAHPPFVPGDVIAGHWGRAGGHVIAFAAVPL